MDYELSYAGVPFCLDEPELLSRIEAVLPQHQHRDYLPPSPYPGKNVWGLARPGWLPFPEVGIGELFWPVGASRWAVFRGLARTDQVLRMREEALPSSGATAKPLVMNSPAQGMEPDGKSYRVQASMYLLPPRRLSGCEDDCAVWLVTLVDERYYWQFKDGGIRHPTGSTTWDQLISDLAGALGISLDTGIDAVYLKPEPDSHIWSNYESAALLLDACCWNVGRTLVRGLDGSCKLQTNADAVKTIEDSRAKALLAGGDQLADTVAGQAVLPSKVRVTFPYYVTDHPRDVPHFKQSRQTGTVWIDDSYSDVYKKDVTLKDAGYSGYTGHPGIKVFRDTCKAKIEENEDEEPTNQTELDDLAKQLAKDYYAGQIGAGLDECYPGTMIWTPEAINDLFWTYRNGVASLRVSRAEWNFGVEEFQHSTGTDTRGGRVIPQTWREKDPDEAEPDPPATDVANVRVGSFDYHVFDVQSTAIMDEAYVTLKNPINRPVTYNQTVTHNNTVTYNNPVTHNSTVTHNNTVTYNQPVTHNNTVTYNNPVYHNSTVQLPTSGTPSNNGEVSVGGETPCHITYRCGGSNYTVERQENKDEPGGYPGLGPDGEPTVTWYVRFFDTIAPTPPASGMGHLYAKDVGGVSHIFYQDETGTEYDLTDIGGSGAIVVEELDGTPSVNPTTTLQFGAGFVVSDQGSDTALVELSVAPTTKNLMLMGG